MVRTLLLLMLPLSAIAIYGADTNCTNYISLSYGVQPTPTSLMLLFDQASTNQLGSGGPLLPQIYSGTGLLSIDPFIPHSLLRVQGWFENTWKQFEAPWGSSGYTSYGVNKDGSCGYGIMQITSGMTTQDKDTYTPRSVMDSPAYNIGTGALVLLRKWNADQIVGSNDPHIYENWYYAIWGYNSCSDVNNPSIYNPNFPHPFPVYNGDNRGKMPYQEAVFSALRSPSAVKNATYNGIPLWPAVPVTSPDPSQFPYPTTNCRLPVIPPPQPSHSDGPTEPTVVTDVSLDPPNGPYTVGQTISATFVISNESSAPVTFKVLTLGGRLNGDNSCAGGCPDFTHQPISGGTLTLAPGEPYKYTGTLSLNKAGTYSFFAAYQNVDGSWNTAIPTDPGVANTAAISVGGLSCTYSAATASNLPLLRPYSTTSSCGPLSPDTPSPANGASNVGLVAQLTWSGGTAAASYQLYFGTSNPPPLLTTVSGTGYGLSLSPNTTYFWYVVPNIVNGSASNIWTFSTIPGTPQLPSAPTTLSPSDGAGNVSLSPTLVWSPVSGVANYLVYFGTTNPPYGVATTSNTSYSPGVLGGNTTFYWRVVATNAYGSSSSSIVSFITATSPASGPVLVSGLSNPTGIASDSDSVYWAEANGLIRKVAKSGGIPLTLSSNGSFGTHVAVDADSVYFGDGGHLRSVPKSGGAETIIAPYNPTGVAVDASSVYWTEYNTGAVRKVLKSGGSVTTLATGSTNPVGIATDGSYVYWSEASSPGAVWRVPVAGGVVMLLGNNVNNHGIAIDGNNTYWGEYVYADQGSIDKESLTGASFTRLATGLNQVWDLAADGSSVFWIENRPTNGAVKQVTISGGSPAVLTDSASDPVALTVDSRNVYWIERNGGGTAAGSLKMAAKNSTVQVTVNSNPPGLPFYVDGVSFNTQQVFVWFTGTTHTITAGDRSLGTGAQCVWQSWSDGGGAAHSISPGFNSTYVATFSIQYYFTANSSTGGVISPPSGWYDSGTTIPVAGIPGSGYSFAGFSGDITGIVTPQNLVVNSPHTVNAAFTSSNNYEISGTVSLSTGGPLSNVTMTLTNRPSVTTSLTGSYMFDALSAGGTYTITPVLSGYRFSPTSLTLSDLTENQTNADFVASQLATVEQASVSSTGFLYSRVTQTFNGSVTIKNTGQAAIAIPIQLLLTGLPSGVTLANLSGLWNGNPYITVPGSASLNPGQSISVPVQFNNPGNAIIAFSPIVYSGVLQ